MNILSIKYMDIFLNPVFLQLIFHQKRDIQQHFIREFMVGFPLSFFQSMSAQAISFAFVFLLT